MVGFLLVPENAGTRTFFLIIISLWDKMKALKDESITNGSTRTEEDIVI